MGMRGLGIAGTIALFCWTACDVLDTSTPDFSNICVPQYSRAEVPTSLWTEVSPPESPAARNLAMSVYDEANDRLVLFGGKGENDTIYGDTWVFAPATDTSGAARWTELKPMGTAPAARRAAVLAYDAKNNRMMLALGGDEKNGFKDTFVLSNANGLGGMPQWTKLSTTNDGPFRTYAVSSYDPKTNTLFVFGGYDGPDAKDEVWTLSNANGMDTTPST